MSLGSVFSRFKRRVNQAPNRGFCPEARDLVFWLPMDRGEGIGPPVERAIGNMLGVFNSVPVWEPGPNGNMGLRFDGTDDYVDYASSPSTRIEGDITIAFWLRAVNTGEIVIACEKGNDVLNSVSYGFGWSSDGKLAAISGNELVSTSNYVVLTNDWQHVVMRRDHRPAQSVRTWNYVIDGVDKGSFSYTSDNDPGTNGDSLTFGTRGSGEARDLHLNGHLADIRIWSYRMPDELAMVLHTPQSASRLRRRPTRRLMRLFTETVIATEGEDTVNLAQDGRSLGHALASGRYRR